MCTEEIREVNELMSSLHLRFSNLREPLPLWSFVRDHVAVGDHIMWAGAFGYIGNSCLMILLLDISP